MTLEELVAYAWERYKVREERMWKDFPGFSVLRHPGTGIWLALLMRQWDGELGEMAECCDLKCGRECLQSAEASAKGLSRPFRMNGPKWVGVRFGPETDRKTVLELFDRAVREEERKRGTCTIVVASQLGRPKERKGDEAGKGHRETVIVFGGDAEGVEAPERIRRMLGLYEYGDGSNEQRRRNFVRQGRFMADYEDDAPWTGEFRRYFPTYHDLNVRQLRGYFTWRTRWRRGERRATVTSMAYLYVYELLNGIGASSPEDALRQLRGFRQDYVEAGFGDASMESNLRRWMLEFAVLHGMPAETAEECADPETVRRDHALAALKEPEGRGDGEVVEALRILAGGKVASALPAEREHPVAETWRIALRRTREKGADLFKECFGESRRFAWHPLANAVFFREGPDPDADYRLNGCRSFSCRGGVWHQWCYEMVYANPKRLRELLHETEVRLRRHFRTGHYLKENPREAWARPYVEEAIAEEERRKAEAARPRIEIRTERLDGIREDAIWTRDSLLTEEELEEAEAPTPTAPAASGPGEPVETRILRMLLRGESPEGVLKEFRLMPSVIADTLNETYHDEIGDNIVLCEADRLTLVEEYAEDVQQLIDRTT